MTGVRAIVCGGRDFRNKFVVFEALDKFQATLGIGHIIEGGQRTKDIATGNFEGGADYWAMKWAQSRHVTFDTVPAEWTKLGRKAGPVRNAKMLSQFAPDCIIAFPGGKGTQDMIDRSERTHIPVYRVKDKAKISHNI